MNSHIEIISKKLKENGCRLNDTQIFDLYNSFLEYRYLKDEFFYYPDMIMDSILKSLSKNKLCYIPLDLIELRDILKRDKFIANNTFLFSFEFAKKHFVDYPILLGYEVKTEDFGGISLAEKDKDFKISRIYLREEYINTKIREEVRRILSEENIAIDFDVISDVVALRNKASSVFNLKLAQVDQKKFNNIEISPVEKSIMKLVLDVKNSNQRFSDVQLRIVGGWVRDKLMKKNSDDIDITISHVTGVHFVQSIAAYAKQRGINEVGNIYSTSLDKVGEANLESAALEVGAIELYGQKVEFVNLRTETYNENSRVPVQKATNDPKEDAVRRDLTINALYYNIETGQVEDYVDGLKDFEIKPDGSLYPKTIRTPANETDQNSVDKIYKDDPLRLLRALRFLSVYKGAKLHPTIIQSMKSPEVLNLYTKLKPERGSKEVRKMMEGDNVIEATRVLLETGLYKKVFNVPTEWHNIDISQQNPYHNLNLMEHTLSVMSNFKSDADVSGMDKKEKGLMMMSTLLHDFGKMAPHIRKPKIDKETGKPTTFIHNGQETERMTYIDHETESAKFARKIMESMGFDSGEKKFVETIVKHHMTPHDLVAKSNPKSIGRFLNEVGDLYDKVFGHSVADSLSKGNLTPEEIANIRKERADSLQNINNYKKEVGDAIYKPLIDGNEVIKLATETVPDLINKYKGMVTVDGKKKHYIAIINDRLMKQQWSKLILNAEQAKRFVVGQLKQIYRDEEKLNQQVKNTTEINPTNKDNFKKADATDSGNSNMILIAPQLASGRHNEIVTTKPYVQTGYVSGRKVKLHPGGTGEGLWFEPMEGVISSSKNNKVIVEWKTGKYKGKKSAYDMTDTISMAKLELID